MNSQACYADQTEAVLAYGQNVQTGRNPLTTVVATHSIGSMDQWLKGKDREKLFPTFCSSYRLFKHADGKRVAIVWEDVDLGKMQATLASAEGAAAKTADTVIDPSLRSKAGSEA